MKGSCERKEPRDSGDSGSYGNGTSMVLGEGKKSSGEEVALAYNYRFTERGQGQTNKFHGIPTGFSNQASVLPAHALASVVFQRGEIDVKRHLYGYQ